MSVTYGIGQIPCSLEHYLVVYCFCTVFSQDGNKFRLFGWEIAAAGSHQLEGDWLYIDTLWFSDGLCFRLFCGGFCESKAVGQMAPQWFLWDSTIISACCHARNWYNWTQKNNRNSHNCLKTSSFHYASTAVTQCIFITAPSLLVGLPPF